MSIKALNNIRHNGTNYKCEDIIEDITKNEALRLINLNAAELIDNKFKQPREKIKKQILFKNRKNRIRENNYT